jgi:hypothetical protein
MYEELVTCKMASFRGTKQRKERVLNQESQEAEELRRFSIGFCVIGVQRLSQGREELW